MKVTGLSFYDGISIHADNIGDTERILSIYKNIYFLNKQSGVSGDAVIVSKSLNIHEKKIMNRKAVNSAEFLSWSFLHHV